jgi:hypothetical protein
MATVFSFVDYTPPARYDDVPWTHALIQQSDASDGTFAQIDSLALDPVDGDPEHPQVRNLTTHLASDTPQQWYRIVWADASSGMSSPTIPIMDLGFDVVPFTTVDELFRVLKVRTPSADQTAAANRVLLAAAQEIISEIDLSLPEISEPGYQICATVNLDRAADLWRHTESAPGILGIVDEAVLTIPGRYSWARYAARLSPLKDQWGIA